MFNLLRLIFIVAAIQVSAMPLKAEDGRAEDIGIMSISLRDAVKPNFGIQGSTQGAGTPNFSGVGALIPLSVSNTSLWFVDIMANYDFADRDHYSSIVDTTIKGGTISTSTRIGYRWINKEQSTLLGINAGYDSRPTASGYADSGVKVDDGYAFFQQVAVNAHATLGKLGVDAYGLIPFGETTKELNWNYNAGALSTFGGDISYELMPNLSITAGSYYQNGDYNKCLGGNEVDGFGFSSAVNYELSDSLNLGLGITHDEAFDTRYLAKFTYRFSNNQIKLSQKPATTALRSAMRTPAHRLVRLHDPTACAPNIRRLRRLLRTSPNRRRRSGLIR